jgi:hypothetical protein
MAVGAVISALLLFPQLAAPQRAPKPSGKGVGIPAPITIDYPNVRPSTPARSGGGGFGFLGGASVSFYAWNPFRRFDEDWETKWAKLAIRRMEAWGFNMGPGRVNKVWEAKPKPYLVLMGQW